MRLKWPSLQMGLEKRKHAIGYAFISPFIVGFIVFFVYPVIQTIRYSLSQLSVLGGAVSFDWVGLSNYRYILMTHPTFVRTVVETAVVMMGEIPVILAFSFFIAVLLNQRFRGRLLARVIVFLPVVTGAGIVLILEQTDYVAEMMRDAQAGRATLATGRYIRGFLMELNFPETALEYLLQAVDSIPRVVRASGVQILIFLAGLQSISPSLYEASEVEGATSWENFWLITFPQLAPLILTNTVYTIVASFTSPYNDAVMLIRNSSFGAQGFGVGTAMSVVYLVAVAVVVGVFVGLISSRIAHYEQ